MVVAGGGGGLTRPDNSTFGARYERTRTRTHTGGRERATALQKKPSKDAIESNSIIKFLFREKIKVTDVHQSMNKAMENSLLS